MSTNCKFNEDCIPTSPLMKSCSITYHPDLIESHPTVNLSDIPAGQFFQGYISQFKGIFVILPSGTIHDVEGTKHPAYTLFEVVENATGPFLRPPFSSELICGQSYSFARYAVKDFVPVAAAITFSKFRVPPRTEQE